MTKRKLWRIPQPGQQVHESIRKRTKCQANVHEGAQRRTRAYEGAEGRMKAIKSLGCAEKAFLLLAPLYFDSLTSYFQSICFAQLFYFRQTQSNCQYHSDYQVESMRSNFVHASFQQIPIHFGVTADRQ